MSARQLSAEQWRVISYLYHPDQISRRNSPTLADVIDKQAVDRADVVEVVERGLVQSRVGGEECTRGPLKRLPEKAIRLRLTRAGIYRASHDPQHLILLALRSMRELSAYTLEHTLTMGVSFGEVCDVAERGLIAARLGDDDSTEVRLRDWALCTSFVYTRLTKLGKTFIAYQ